MHPWTHVASEVRRLHERMDGIERSINEVLLRLEFVAGAGAGDRPQPSDLVNGLARSGHRLQAVKAYREESGVPTRIAEMVVDALTARASDRIDPQGTTES